MLLQWTLYCAVLLSAPGWAAITSTRVTVLGRDYLFLANEVQLLGV